MKKLIWLLLLIPVLLLGCGHRTDSRALTGLIFERGSGSTWGHQLYISMTQTHITVLRYIPEGTTQLQTLEQLPITPAQWQQLAQLLEQLSPELEKPKLFGTLFQKQDGTDYRRLTLVYGTEQLPCRWPADGALLEALLEQLVSEVTG